MNDYIAQVLLIADAFTYQLCDVCNGDLDAHMIGPDMFGNAHTYCTNEEG